MLPGGSGARAESGRMTSSYSAFLGAQWYPPAVREVWVRSVGQEETLEKEVATHSSILAWEISWTEEPGRLQSLGLQSLALV